MKLASSLTALCIAAASASFLTLPAQAHEQQWGHEGHHGKAITPQEREAWIKKRLDREAAQLEIKASQQAAWDAYAAAKLDLVSSFGAMAQKPAAQEEGDAAAVTRKHAERATEIAQKLTKLADATDKLQAALTDDQRKVLNRIAREHQRPFGEHGASGEHMQHGMNMAKPGAKMPPAQAKQPQ